MREIEKVFRTLKSRSEGTLIAYITGGDPKPEYTFNIVEALINGGADIIELGIPFSDPIADGPTIQAATVRALKAGTTPMVVLKIAKKIKKNHNVPIAILTYYNPIYRMGLANFFKAVSACEVDGLIVPDLPIEEANNYKKVAEAHEIDTIFLAAPSTTQERLKEIINNTSGFLYLVSVFGVTGTRETIQNLTIKLIKKFYPLTHRKIPLAVGFGLSKPEHIRRVILNGADGAIVGSMFVKIIEENLEDVDKMLRKIESQTKQLKRATSHHYK